MTSKYDNNNYRIEIVNIMENYNLTDIWSDLYGNQKQMQWKREHLGSRIDYFIISEHLSSIVNCFEIKHMAHTDHYLLKLSLQKIIDTNIYLSQ